MYSQALKAAVDRLDPASFASISPRHGERNRGRDGIAQGGVEDHAPPRHGSLGSAPRAPYGRPSGHLWLRHHRVHTEPKLYSMSYLTIDGSLVVVTAGEGGGYVRTSAHPESRDSTERTGRLPKWKQHGKTGGGGLDRQDSGRCGLL